MQENRSREARAPINYAVFYFYVPTIKLTLTLENTTHTLLRFTPICNP